MKKLLALLMAAAMLLSFAACGNDKPDDETTAETTTENVAANVDVDGEEETDAEGEEETEEVTEVVTDESGEAVTDKEGHAVTEKVTKKESEKSTKKNNKVTPTKQNESKDKPVSQWTKQEIIDYYNAAVVKTDASSNPPAGHSNMVLGNDGKITADGGMGMVLKVASPIIESTLKRNSNDTHNIPGEGKLKLDDVKTIKATEKNGVITIEMTIKEQTDGPTADGSAGPVGRAIGTLGNLDKALNELGATISRGKDTVKLTYDDVTIKANINQKTGMVTGGKWHYNVNIYVKDADIKLGLEFTAKNLKAVLDYSVTF